ncbi:MAG: ABC transporter permease [SAR202 cluster bacterium]|jgi:peptide/nickel transport system permease protein|nr:peptide ABC transporter permease [Chloroflexota bacterium]MDP6420905.1 ABC transporter permease [SAR202 cluster bacterium]HAL48917.1 peptide ABC transporter permease [Dehalococcoidia bacterium]MDP6663239.1 ABC transporter permease [SAR202 cluster bacterium]MDP6800536.1 ABC transporter permease [SAR202 cluster bacterium]|tara:strand:+ start:1627 stop:2772 length:1146 start_codon:yes stop_codon:yes gene_type:complete
MAEESAALGQVLDDAADRSSERVYSATQWQLMWWRLRKHRLAMAAAIVLLGFYIVVLGANFLAVSDPVFSEAKRGEMPPQRLHFFDGFKPGLYVTGVSGQRDSKTFKKVYVNDPEVKIPVRLFARGYEYDFLGFITTDRHLFGVSAPHKSEETLFLLGTDVQGRDVWSRLMVATRVSMLIGLVSVVISLILGVLLGGISGYYGGWADIIIQRVIEILRSIPTIPLWMGIAAAVPREWSIIKMYFAITIIISLIGWTTLAREVRGRFLSLRDEDFVTAAELSGASKMRIIFRHMAPSFLSHIIASTTLALPAIIISETSLSFLGLGLRPPAISWGVMLQAAQNVQTIALTPWLMIPAIPVIGAVLAFNFLGDGLRDAADPYG